MVPDPPKVSVSRRMLPPLAPPGALEEIPAAPLQPMDPIEVIDQKK